MELNEFDTARLATNLKELDDLRWEEQIIKSKISYLREKGSTVENYEERLYTAYKDLATLQVKLTAKESQVSSIKATISFNYGYGL